MMALVRILTAAAFIYALYRARVNAVSHPDTGDLMNAFYLAVCVIVGIGFAVAWAPVFGAKLSEPLTAVLTRSTYYERKNRLLQFIRWLERHGYRRLTLFFCFLEGIRCPGLPAPFVIGLRNAGRGSWLEKVYAREVFKYGNAQHCVLAYEALKQHGIDPRPHPNPEINLVLLSLERAEKPEPEVMVVPAAVAASPLKRDPRIELFAMAGGASGGAVGEGGTQAGASRGVESGA